MTYNVYVWHSNNWVLEKTVHSQCELDEFYEQESRPTRVVSYRTKYICL